MKYFARIQSERGKIVGAGGNEYITVEFMDGNNIIAKLTVRDGKIYDQDNNAISGAVLYNIGK